ncbi:hypothetical protein [Oceanobacillus sp. 1P07AA]|uniref:hypothetical protein n=1 Tax=Oceanobacillus sp. 1P07AA TaxID=3132293 RepID=UPI0039A4230B
MTINRKLFQKRLSNALYKEENEIEELADYIISSSMDEQGEKQLKKYLADSGIGDHWNLILDKIRSGYLAEKIMYHIDVCSPKIIDVLSGTGTLASALRQKGAHVMEVERLEHYPNLQPNNNLVDLEDREILNNMEADALIVVASLHHEKELDKFLGWLSTIQANTIIIIENLKNRETNIETHKRMDWFFNRCLNNFEADCPGWYWDKSQWELVLSSLGDVKWEDNMSNVPGIPFDYDLFVVKRRG